MNANRRNVFVATGSIVISLACSLCMGYALCVIQNPSEAHALCEISEKVRRTVLVDPMSGSSHTCIQVPRLLKAYYGAAAGVRG